MGESVVCQMIGRALPEPSPVAAAVGSSGQEHCAVSGGKLSALLVWRVNAAVFLQELAAASLLPKLVSPAAGKVAQVPVSSGRVHIVVWTDTDSAMGVVLNNAKDKTRSSQAHSVVCPNPFIAIQAGQIARATGGRGLEAIAAMPEGGPCEAETTTGSHEE